MHKPHKTPIACSAGKQVSFSLLSHQTRQRELNKEIHECRLLAAYGAGGIPSFRGDNNAASRIESIITGRMDELVVTLEDILLRFGEDYKDAMRIINFIRDTRYNGPGNIRELNSQLQATLNPKVPGQPEITYGRTIYRKGDKVIMLVNNYDAGYLNGDLGTVVGVGEAGLEIEIMGKTITVDRTSLDEVTLAYAISVHKSQGSEFEDVIIAMSEEPATMLRRNLLYTAITRAKKRCVIIAEKPGIHQRKGKPVYCGGRHTLTRKAPTNDPCEPVIPLLVPLNRCGG